MAYSEDYRRRTVEYYHEGHSQVEVARVFKVGSKTLRDWENRMEKGNLKPLYPKTRRHRKLPPHELKVYVEQYPDAFLTEIGAHFGCSDTAVSKALKKLNITHKKRL